MRPEATPTLSYAQRTLDSPNPLTRFAHRSRYRISLDLSDRLLRTGGRIVDFGAGDGSFLAQLHDRRPDAILSAIEPIMRIPYEFVERLNSLADYPSGSADLVTAFETLEHLSDEQIDRFLRDAMAALSSNGRLLITVPIMYGAALR